MAYSLEKIARRARHDGSRAQHEMEDRIGELSREIATIAHSLQDLGADAMDGASEIAHRLQRQGGRALARTSREAGRAAAAVRNDPVPAIVAIGVVALIATLLTSRR